MSLLRQISTFFLAITVCCHAAMSANAAGLEDLTGEWHGALSVGAQSLPLILHITRTEDGFSATLDSPAQGAAGIPAADLTYTEHTFTFKIPSLGGSYQGTVSADITSIDGVWSQSGQMLPLVFRRSEKSDDDPEQHSEITQHSGIAPERPQTPVPPFPYDTLPMEFSSLDQTIMLSGSLTIPHGDGPYPALVLITGSGPQDRDETIAGHKPFLVIADHLSRNGMAVLRYDDRGIGQSTGDFSQATTHDFAKDAAGALQALRQRDDIDPHRISYLGHSEGGVVAILAHSAHQQGAGLVLMTTPILPYPEYVIDQVRALNLAAGASPRIADANAKTQRTLIAAALTGQTPEQAGAAVEQALRDLGIDAQTAKTQAAPFSSPWLFALLQIDPRSALSEIHAPVLALWGGKDIQVDAKKNHGAAQHALINNTQARLEILPTLNHLLQPAISGDISEYGTITTTIAPAALDAITVWLQASL